MKKVLAFVIGALMMLAGSGMAETVQLPESRYTVTIPAGMIFDGPTEGTAEAFAYIDEEIGLTVHFFRYDGSMTDVVAAALAYGAEDIGMTSVNGVQMMVFRFPVEEDGWKAIGYILQDGDATLEIRFWYGTQEAADMTKTIMESIEETETV